LITGTPSEMAGFFSVPREFSYLTRERHLNQLLRWLRWFLNRTAMECLQSESLTIHIKEMHFKAGISGELIDQVKFISTLIAAERSEISVLDYPI